MLVVNMSDPAQNCTGPSPTTFAPTYRKTIDQNRTIAVDTQVERHGKHPQSPLSVTINPRTKSKRTAALLSFHIGIAEGGARTHDLEVDLFAVIRATRSTD
jgi:hypothetical protein